MKKIVLFLTIPILCMLSSCSDRCSTAMDYKAGTYEASVAGMNGDIKILVTFKKKRIESIDVISHNETAGISDVPIKDIPAKIIKKQSLSIDIITGATITSKAIMEAVENAVKQAGADPVMLKTQNNSSRSK